MPKRGMSQFTQTILSQGTNLTNLLVCFSMITLQIPETYVESLLEWFKETHDFSKGNEYSAGLNEEAIWLWKTLEVEKNKLG